MFPVWIGIDFDHTIAKNEDIEPGDRYHKPFPGARDAILNMKESGYKIMIHSCNRKAWIEEWMKHWDIPYDLVWDGLGKPVCSAYVDDLAVPFKGDWGNTLADIRSLIED